MKIILLQDVAKIGRRFDVVEVPDGYALNQLIPKHMAEPATPANLKRVEKMNKDKVADASASAEEFNAAATALKDTKLEIKTDVNDKDHLFKAISADDVVAAAKDAGVALDASLVEFAEPIKEAGEHVVSLKHGDLESKITILVTKA